MATTFKEVRKLQGERVRMQFVDGREVVALLLRATKEIDGSKHLIYDKVESVSGAETCGTVATGCFYANSKNLVSIEAADAKKIARSLRGWDSFGVRQEVEKASPKAWRPCAYFFSHVGSSSLAPYPPVTNVRPQLSLSSLGN